MFTFGKFIINNLFHLNRRFKLFYFIIEFFVVFQILLLVYSQMKIVFSWLLLVFQILLVLRKSFVSFNYLILLQQDIKFMLILIVIGFLDLMFVLRNLELNFILYFSLYFIRYFLAQSHLFLLLFFLGFIILINTCFYSSFLTQIYKNNKKY